MKFSKFLHFWKWFEKNQAIYFDLPNRSKTEAKYLMRELITHLNACGRGISPEIAWETGSDSIANMVFTAYCQSKNFRKIERLVAKAPDIKGWRFTALQPPKQPDFFIAQDFKEVVIDPFDVWFKPPVICGYADREELVVYVAMYGERTWRFEEAVRSIVLNVLGEKAYTLGIANIAIRNLLHLGEPKRAALRNVKDLPQYIQVQDLSSLQITGTGLLRQLK